MFSGTKYILTVNMGLVKKNVLIVMPMCTLKLIVECKTLAWQLNDSFHGQL